MILSRFLSIRYCYFRGKSRDKKRLPMDPLLLTGRDKEILTPIMTIPGFLVVLEMVEYFRGDGLLAFSSFHYKIAIRRFFASHNVRLR
jgi:hypothetical protein